MSETGVVGGGQQARGAQAVAAERRAELLAVTEDEEGRAVPCLLQAAVVVEHVDNVLVALIRRLVAIRLRHQDRERARRRLPPLAYHVLEDRIEVRRVRALERAERVAAAALLVERALPVDVAE